MLPLYHGPQGALSTELGQTGLQRGDKLGKPWAPARAAGDREVVWLGDPHFQDRPTCPLPIPLTFSCWSLLAQPLRGLCHLFISSFPRGCEGDKEAAAPASRLLPETHHFKATLPSSEGPGEHTSQNKTIELQSGPFIVLGSWVILSPKCYPAFNV